MRTHDTLRYPALALMLVLAAATQALDVSISAYQPSICGRPTGEMYASISGGVPPYQVSWSNGAFGEFLNALSPGTYKITVVDSQMDEATAEATIDELTSYPYDLVGMNTTMHCPGGDRYPLSIDQLAQWGNTIQAIGTGVWIHRERFIKN